MIGEKLKQLSNWFSEVSIRNTQIIRTKKSLLIQVGSKGLLLCTLYYYLLLYCYSFKITCLQVLVELELPVRVQMKELDR